MDYEKLAEEFCEVHFLSSKHLDQVLERAPSKGEAGVLLYLFRCNRPVLAGELAKQACLSSGRMANILNGLEKKESIIRQPDMADRRQIHVHLTQIGRDYICALYREAVEHHKRLLEFLGEKDAEEFVKILKKAVAFEVEQAAKHPQALTK